MLLSSDCGVQSSSSSSSPPPADTKGDGQKKRAFAYVFRLMDLSTKMYVAFGSSLKSEKEAFDRAMNLLSRTGVTLDSARLDRYYGTPGHVDSLGDAKVYVIPRSNATVKGSWKWKATMEGFVTDTIKYLEEYYRRESSESWFAADKKMLGWSIAQRREDRIDCAQFCTGRWHNRFNLAALWILSHALEKLKPFYLLRPARSLWDDRSSRDWL